MDKQNLSKHKYIYRIYNNKDIINCERYPIIYINSKVIYYKTVRKQESLGSVPIDKVYKSIEPYIRKSKYFYYDRFYWNLTQEQIDGIVKNIKEQQGISGKTYELTNLKEKLEETEKLLNHYKNKIKELQNE